MTKSLKVLSALLAYPTQELVAAAPEFSGILAAEDLVPERERTLLEPLLDEFATLDLYDLQERYVLLFDRTRSLSLYLFEHVHGESRDRGQAMVDLQSVYEKAGLRPSRNELPDFIPLFLEFLAQQPFAEARELLSQPAHILTALSERLRKRKSSYRAVFQALVGLAKAAPKNIEVEALLNLPDPEPTDLAALDAAWEDEEVRFGPSASSCGTDIAAKIRAGLRPAPGVTRAKPPTKPTRPTRSFRA